MSGWNPVPSTTPSGWGTACSDAWRNWKHERPKSLGHKLIIPKRTSATFLEDDDPKSHKFEKGELFDLLPINILNYINDWIIGLEYNGKFNNAVAHIISPNNPLLRMRTGKNCITYILFGNNLLYQ